MNPETAPESQIDTDPDILEVNYESIDAKNFEKAKEMEKEYVKRYVYAGTIENILKRNVYKEKQALIQSLQQHINPRSGQPYTNQELLCVYLYHVIIGGSLSSNSRDGFQ